MDFSGNVISRELVSRFRKGCFPTKLYILRPAASVYSGKFSVEKDLLRAGLMRRSYAYGVAMAWGYVEKVYHHAHPRPVRLRDVSVMLRAFDVFKYRVDRVNKWPDVKCSASFINNQHYKSREKIGNRELVSRIDGIEKIILDAEDNLRARSESLSKYLREWPDIGNLGPVIEDVQKQQ
jgi:hypothetical protein